MIDHATIRHLAELRRQIDEAESACGQTLGSMRLEGDDARSLAAATPFLTKCARDLEALAGRMRIVAAKAGAPSYAD